MPRPRVPRDTQLHRDDLLTVGKLDIVTHTK